MTVTKLKELLKVHWCTDKKKKISHQNMKEIWKSPAPKSHVQMLRVSQFSLLISQFVNYM